MSDRIKDLSLQTLSDFWGKLSKATFHYRRSDGTWEQQIRESYDHGDGVAILLFNRTTKQVILVRQLRIPTYLNGHKDGMIIEVPAGLIEDHNPIEAIIKEVEEETGFRITEVKKVCETYVTPGSVTEKDHLCVGEDTEEMRVHAGGGRMEEQEDIEVLTLDFDKAYSMIATGEIIDAKTIILLQWAKIERLFHDTYHT